jgi:hypothetical protein
VLTQAFIDAANRRYAEARARRVAKGLPPIRFDTFRTLCESQSMNEQFEKNQKDLSLDDVYVLWCATRVELYQRIDTILLGKFLTSFSVEDGKVSEKVQRWCVKNHYRCSQIKNGKICL